MRVMVLVKASAASEASVEVSRELRDEMDAFNDALIEAGLMGGNGEGLKPTVHAARVRFRGDERVVERGPFGVDGLVSGYWIWNVSSLDEAIAWAKRCPYPMPGDEAELELRPIISAEDSGEALTPEFREHLRAHEEDQRLRLGQ